MIPVSQVLAARYQPMAAEGLQAISSISPVEAASAESPLWQRLKPGLQFSATILQKQAAPATPTLPAQLAMFKVNLSHPDLGTQQVWMQLPAMMPEGQRLQLQVLRGATSQSAPEVKWRSDSAVSTLTAALGQTDAQADAAPVQAGLTSLLNQASDVRLSRPAQQLQQWLSASPLPTDAATLRAREVISQHPEKSQVLAQELKHALDRSGLFYESHLKEATLGTRPWHQLLQEPQNQANFQAPNTVAQQLQILEQQRLTWQGEVWPGQTMTWQVSERPAAQASDHATPEMLMSNLTLTMPQLGEVGVRITMIDGQFSIRLEADTTNSQHQLKAGRQQLVNQLSQAGLSLASVQISQGVIDAGG